MSQKIILFSKVSKPSLYPEEMGFIVSVWKLLQLRVSPPQFINLMLQSLHESFSFTHYSLFSISDHLCDLRASFLYGLDDFTKDPLTVLHCCLCRALQDTHYNQLLLLTQSAVGLKISLNNHLKKSETSSAASSKLTFWDPTASFSSQSFISLSWICCLIFPCVSSNCFCWTKQSKSHKYIISETKGNKRFLSEFSLRVFMSENWMDCILNHTMKNHTKTNYKH